MTQHSGFGIKIAFWELIIILTPVNTFVLVLYFFFPAIVYFAKSVRVDLFGFFY